MNIDKITGRRKIRVTPDFLRHARKCCICRHPLREEIESDFLLWRNPRQIMKEYELAHHAAIYRHAHATGLATRRRENAYSVFDSIVEQVDDVQVTASTILRAMRAYSCLTPKGRWIDPPRRIIHETVRHPAPAARARSKEAPAAKRPRRRTNRPGLKRLRPLRNRSARRELPAARKQSNEARKQSTDDFAKRVPLGRPSTLSASRCRLPRHFMSLRYAHTACRDVDFVDSSAVARQSASALAEAGVQDRTPCTTWQAVNSVGKILPPAKGISMRLRYAHTAWRALNSVGSLAAARQPRRRPETAAAEAEILIANARLKFRTPAGGQRY